MLAYKYASYVLCHYVRINIVPHNTIRKYTSVLAEKSRKRTCIIRDNLLPYDKLAKNDVILTVQNMSEGAEVRKTPFGIKYIPLSGPTLYLF